MRKKEVQAYPNFDCELNIFTSLVSLNETERKQKKVDVRVASH